MRKILLTTTALVALGGVSAASAVDISGNYAFTYTDTSNTGGSADAAGVSGDAFGSDAILDFTNSITTDAGLTFDVLYRINHTPATEDMKITVSSDDFGSFMMGPSDGPVDSNDGFMIGSNLTESAAGPGTTANSALETASTGSGLHGAGTTTDSNSGNIGYSSLNFGGFQVHAGYEDGGSAAGSSDDTSSILLTYDMGMVKVGYASVDTTSANDDGADTKETLYGGEATIMGAAVRVGFHNAKTDDTTANGGGTLFDIDTRDIGIGYDVSDALNIHYANIRSEEKGNSTNAGDKMESQIYGLYYTIAPGVTANLEYSESDYTDATAGSGNSDGRNQTYGFLKVAF
tara:strand:- start:358 stop:1395 length:1038 start_codon:yes stop_codon:yes gene_type:complete